MNARLRQLEARLAALEEHEDLNSRRDEFLREIEVSMRGERSALLPRAWEPCQLHEKQRAYWEDTTRFQTVAAGRRTFKTVLSVRKCVRAAVCWHGAPESYFVMGAPTFGQAKRLFWGRLKGHVPKWAIDRTSESELSIFLRNGAVILVFGFDVPARIEGVPQLVYAHLDEVPDMRPETWATHIRPALSDTGGSAAFSGVPEGRDYFCELWERGGRQEGWSSHHWTSREVMPLYLGEEGARNELEQAANDLDERTYEQEYDAMFLKPTNAAYWAWTHENIRSHPYDAKAPLIITMDFNVAPGGANVVQEFNDVTYVIDEVCYPTDSTTPRVVDELLKRYGKHEGPVYLHGDPSGGARGTAKVMGSDWDLVRMMWPKAMLKVAPSAPPVRGRLAAMNSRLCSMDRTRRMFVDARCKRFIRDMEGVKLETNGDLDKSDPELTHFSDGVGYYIAKQWPVRRSKVSSSEV